MTIEIRIRRFNEIRIPKIENIGSEGMSEITTEEILTPFSLFF